MFAVKLTLSPPNELSTASIFKVLQCRSKMIKMLSESQTACIRMRHQITWRLIRIQAVYIWHFGCDWRAKGKGVQYRQLFTGGQTAIQKASAGALCIAVVLHMAASWT